MGEASDVELARLREKHANQAESIRSYQADIRDLWIPMRDDLERLRSAVRDLADEWDALPHEVWKGAARDLRERLDASGPAESS